MQPPNEAAARKTRCERMIPQRIQGLQPYNGTKGVRAMQENRQEAERIPSWQVVLDDPFLLLALGLGVPLVLYVIWGILEITMVPYLKP